jgi:hypothetical protein
MNIELELVLLIALPVLLLILCYMIFASLFSKTYGQNQKQVHVFPKNPSEKSMEMTRLAILLSMFK